MNIKFRDGHQMSWDSYRRLMKGEISPFKAVAETRRQPAVARARPQPAVGRPWSGAAYDQMPAPAAKFDQNGGRLSRVFVDATNNYLRDAGLSDEDCEVIDAVLQKYVDPGAEDAENLDMPDQQQIRVGGPRGPVGAGDRGRRFALDEDQHGQLRRNLAVAMPLDQSRGFAGRFPEAVKIRVL
jgi:hypothetical protein